MRQYLKNFIAFLLGCIVAMIILETFLQLYNPFPTTIDWEEVRLPINQKYTFQNDWNPYLDSTIIHTKNSIGFRGEEVPEDFDKSLSILAVGGSTTECMYLSDGKDWPNLLGKKLSNQFPNLWINNAGFDGHSTFGHQLLIEKYLTIISPKYIIFLVGSNDIALSNAQRDYMFLSIIQGFNQKTLIWEKFIKQSEVFKLINKTFRFYIAKDVAHKKKDFSSYPHSIIDTSLIQTEIKAHESFLISYEERLIKLIKTCRQFNTEPILLTQPSWVGSGVDSITKINLETITQGDLNGKTYWMILEEYNSVTKKVGKEFNVKTIDLANLLPKNSLYFYDHLHFTNEGAKVISEILLYELKGIWIDQKLN